MRRTLVATSIAASLSFLAGPEAAGAQRTSSSLRCGTHLISVGDTSHTLRAQCGSPDFVASYPVRRGVARVSASQSTARFVEEEVQLWTYAGKETDFLRTVVVQRGQVRTIRVESPVRGRAADCKTEADFRRQRSIGAVYVACGEPVDRTRWRETEAQGNRAGGAASRTVVRERWIYDPGPGSLLRVVEFENGRLSSVTSAERSPS